MKAAPSESAGSKRSGAQWPLCSSPVLGPETPDTELLATAPRTYDREHKAAGIEEGRRKDGRVPGEWCHAQCQLAEQGAGRHPVLSSSVGLSLDAAG